VWGEVAIDTGGLLLKNGGGEVGENIISYRSKKKTGGGGKEKKAVSGYKKGRKSNGGKG